jgi:hypothetical protein
MGGKNMPEYEFSKPARVTKSPKSSTALTVAYTPPDKKEKGPGMG